MPRTQATLRGRDRTAFAVALMVELAAFFYWVALAFPASADKNDFSIDFSAAAPGSYNTATGGGAYDSGTNGSDIVDSLAAGSVACGDIVSYLTQVTIDADAVGTQMITFDYTFAVEGTSGNRAGHIDVTGLAMNYASSAGEGPGGLDSGINDDGGSSISGVIEGYDAAGDNPPGSTYPATAEELNLMFDLDDLEAGESVVFRIDVLLACDAGSGSGLVQATQNGVSLGSQSVPGGGETIPLVGFGSTAATTTTQPLVTTTQPLVDDDSASGDDDSASGGDDSASGDDDSASGDDDSASGDDGDDDSASGDDDSASGDDDSASGGDDSASGDDDIASVDGHVAGDRSWRRAAALGACRTRVPLSRRTHPCRGRLRWRSTTQSLIRAVCVS